jgi:hypothetical protein
MVCLPWAHLSFLRIIVKALSWARGRFLISPVSVNQPSSFLDLASFLLAMSLPLPLLRFPPTQADREKSNLRHTCGVAFVRALPLHTSPFRRDRTIDPHDIVRKMQRCQKTRLLLLKRASEQAMILLPLSLAISGAANWRLPPSEPPSSPDILDQQLEKLLSNPDDTVGHRTQVVQY